MGYLALYRKYRPTNFDDLVGQSEVSKVIKNEILNHKISHAYLFSGPRGTGKTSTAKIIAKMINCIDLGEDGIPCGKCDSCLNFYNSSDIVEIDAASNNGVDEIREIRDKVNLVPTFGKYKIYIIDEVHMLTTQAFNALLKTLEEPPPHIIFILATTEFYKIPITVVSRCQKFQFLKFSNDDIVRKLREIAKRESIIVNDEILYEIARLSDGGLRDAINMLDQLSSFRDGEFTVTDVYKLNGVLSYVEYKNLLICIYKGDVEHIVQFVDEMDKNGKSLDRFVEDLMSFLKDILVYKNTSILNATNLEKNEALKELVDVFSVQELYNFIISLNELSVRLKSSSFGKILLITEFIKISKLFSKQSNDSNCKVKLENYSESNRSLVKDNPITSVVGSNEVSSDFEFQKTDSSNEQSNSVIITDKVKKIRINNAFATASKEAKESFQNNWGTVKEKLSNDKSYVSIAGMMNDIEVLVVGINHVIFLAQYDSLLERLFSKLDVIEKLLFEVFDKEYKVVFLLKDEWNFEKTKYISNLKLGKKYEYIEEQVFCDNSQTQSSDEMEDDIQKVAAILGNDVISYE